jgi:hypothetical protein
MSDTDSERDPARPLLRTGLEAQSAARATRAALISQQATGADLKTEALA